MATRTLKLESVIRILGVTNRLTEIASNQESWRKTNNPEARRSDSTSQWPQDIGRTPVGNTNRGNLSPPYGVETNCGVPWASSSSEPKWGNHKHIEQGSRSATIPVSQPRYLRQFQYFPTTLRTTVL